MSEIQLDVQDILNDLQDKLTAAQMAEVYARAEVNAYKRRVGELEQVVADLNRAGQEAQSGFKDTHQVIEVE